MAKSARIVIYSLKKSFQDIILSPFLFLVLFFTEALFIIIFSSIFTKYAPLILSSLRDITSNLQQLVQAGDLGIAYSTMLINFAVFVLLSYLAYMLVNGVNWELTYFMAFREINYLRYLRKFIVVALIFTLPLFALLSLAADLLFRINTLFGVIFIWIIVLSSFYFMYISFGLINPDVFGFRDFVKHIKKTFKFGKENLFVMLLSYFFISIIYLLLVALIYIFVESNILLLTAFLAAFVLFINISRLFLINLVNNIEGKFDKIGLK